MLAMPAAASAQQTFAASIDNAQVGASCLTGTGTGSGSFTLSGSDFDYNILFSGMTGTETVSHVHGPAAPGSDAGVVFGLPLGSPKVGTQMALTAGQIADLQAGLWYVNIHSTLCAGGEIRGQILPDPHAIPVLGGSGFVAMAGLLLGTMFWMVRRRAQAGTAA